MTTATTPTISDAEYLSRTYAGVLGKLIGVYLGRPFEGWSHQRIVEELGHIKWYVHEKKGVPLLVTDDDVSGTFAFIRALEEHPLDKTGLLPASAIGKTWLNQVVERKSVFWWGGNGISTEHTAYNNLKKGIPAPASGSIAVNGTTVAEQIGAQIFIDGWALVNPGNPAEAARFAEQAGKVSHDGESVYAAQLWAAMEAEAYVSSDIDHLLDTGLSFIPAKSKIARSIAEVRAWVKEDNDWLVTRQRVEDKYGYDKFPGFCHVVPNHLIMIMSVLYAPHDFSLAMEIVNTCGWDTDCNSGNVGCFVAIMLGLDKAFTKASPDWREPLADRAIISSADGGYSINNAARITYDIVNMGRALHGKAPLPQPKDGAQFHFTLPGSVQGFQVTSGDAKAYQADDALVIDLNAAAGPVEVSTGISAPKDTENMPGVYLLSSSPLIYPGQKLKAVLRAGDDLSAPVTARIRLQVFNAEHVAKPVDSDTSVTLTPGDSKLHELEWTVPQGDGWPIVSAGVLLTPASANGNSNGAAAHTSKIYLDSFRWTGQPDFTVIRPADKGRGQTFWDLAWVQSVSNWAGTPTTTLYIGQDVGEGIVIQGTRDWTNYRVTAKDVIVRYGPRAGVAIRAQGLKRWYAVQFATAADGSTYVAIVKALDEQRIELAVAPFKWAIDESYDVAIEAEGATIKATVGDVVLTASDDQYAGGGFGLVVNDGSVSTGTIRIQPVQ
ncbi:uncharacterized protein LOC62_01G001686 [Vanrija pseudolonga]|uniref:ADP-ribosylglycohydrolase n=1 Tax=Vanrija pseudolonga TaxID=143232 RepID=A0AAF1BHX7_9TREE|nr:hypothetical protein LOC62_01G001686 [Vanrija pseudolonga]